MKIRFALLLLLLAAYAASAPAAAPSFDCAKVTSQAEKLVCADTELAQLDREVARLYGLAIHGKNTARHRNLEPGQLGWIKGRNDCWKADDARACVFDNYALRIAELRTAHADARTQDAEGIAMGPLALRCAGLDALIAATFVNSDPGAVVATWADRRLVLKHVPSGSGARYARTYPDGEYVLWGKGREFSLERPGKPRAECTSETIG
jgi:uncharacterized protein